MNTKETAQQIIKIAKEHGAEFAEVVVSQNEFSLKRIRQNQVDQPPAGEQWGIDLSLVKNNRKKTVQFDNPQLAEQIITDALSQMEFLRAQEIVLPTEVFQEVAQPEQLFDSKTAELNGENLIAPVKEIAEKLRPHNLTLSCKIAQGRGEMAYQNSLGTSQHAKFTLATAAFFAFDFANPYTSAYANSGGTSIDHIETDRLAAELLNKCELQKGKEKLDLFADKDEGDELHIDVIVEPYVFGPIFEWLGYFGFNGMFVERGESFISNKLGQQVTGQQISIADDPFDKENRGMGIPFDFEGRPRAKLSLIEKGVVKNAVYDFELARKWQKQPTANALPPSARSEGAAPFNLVVEGGTTSIEEMVKNCKERALWITKLHYLGMKHYQTATMTGVAQHGVFLVENGKVVAPVENVRFEESIPEALKRVEAMGAPRLVFDPMSLSSPGGIVVPAMKIKNFRLVGSTKRSM